MKRRLVAPLALLAGLALSACGSAPGQITGNDRVSVGVSVNDSASTETATKTVTPATEESPEKVAWTITPGRGVTFTFMTRPGSDAVYLRGYRVLEERVTTADGTTTREDDRAVEKMDLYLTSGYTCATRTSLQSCSAADQGFTAANGLPAQHTIYLEGGLGTLARATDADVTQVTTIEFIGVSSNGAPVSVLANGIVSSGIRAGDE